jgi:Flp pilus assembly pilin Flp
MGKSKKPELLKLLVAGLLSLALVAGGYFLGYKIMKGIFSKTINRSIQSLQSQ